jgi:hypothetical protein
MRNLDLNLNIIVLALVSLLVLAFIAGCTKIEKVYVCANGLEVPDQSACGVNKVAGVKKVDAETYAKNYVGAYFVPYGGKSQMVSTYLDKELGDYFATFIVAKKDGAPYQTVVLVDGVTGKVNCTENCEYAGTV